MEKIITGNDIKDLVLSGIHSNITGSTKTNLVNAVNTNILALIQQYIGYGTTYDNINRCLWFDQDKVGVYDADVWGEELVLSNVPNLNYICLYDKFSSQHPFNIYLGDGQLISEEKYNSNRIATTLSLKNIAIPSLNISTSFTNLGSGSSIAQGNVRIYLEDDIAGSVELYNISNTDGSSWKGYNTEKIAYLPGCNINSTSTYKWPLTIVVSGTLSSSLLSQYGKLNFNNLYLKRNNYSLTASHISSSMAESGGYRQFQITYSFSNEYSIDDLMSTTSLTFGGSIDAAAEPVTITIPYQGLMFHGFRLNDGNITPVTGTTGVILDGYHVTPLVNNVAVSKSGSNLVVTTTALSYESDSGTDFFIAIPFTHKYYPNEYVYFVFEIYLGESASDTSYSGNVYVSLTTHTGRLRVYYLSSLNGSLTVYNYDTDGDSVYVSSYYDNNKHLSGAWILNRLIVDTTGLNSSRPYGDCDVQTLIEGSSSNSLYNLPTGYDASDFEEIDYYGSRNMSSASVFNDIINHSKEVWLS